MGWRWWWLVLLLLLVSCAHRPPVLPVVVAPPAVAPQLLLLDDGLSSDVLICVPLAISTEAQPAACLPIDAIRWLLRHLAQG